MEAWIEVRQLRLEGLGVSEISRRTGYDRKTIRRHLKELGPPLYVRKPKPSPLDPYKEQIRARFIEYELTAQRLWREAKERGFPGAYDQVKRYVATLRAERPGEAVIRFETDPGKQAQVDWGVEGTIEIDGVIYKLYCFAMVLGYSRCRYVEYTTSADTATFIQCHLNAFEYLGGYTKEFLYDNTKNVVLKRFLKVSDSEWNPLFLDFIRHFGASIRLCRPYRPCTKGKVERQLRYVEEDFLRGTHFTSLSDLNRKAIDWCNRVNQEVHRTTNVPPIERLAAENLLDAEEKPPYVITLTYERKVTREALVHFDGNRYSVPHEFNRRECLVRLSRNRIKIEIAGAIVAEHELRRGNGSVVIVKEHHASLRANVCRESKQAHQLLLSSREIPEVQQRPLDVYDRVIEEDQRE